MEVVSGENMLIKSEGCEADYKKEADVPYESVPCPCGNLKHWLMKYDEAEGDNGKNDGY